MRSRKSPTRWLFEKEWRELLASRSWWFLLIAMGPLVGMSLISAIQTYAEVSGLNGTAEGVGEAMSPLIGVWAPTFSACELAAVFLLPFVAIRQVSGDRQSGALKLELQQCLSPFTRIVIKATVLLAGWLIAMLPAVSAVLLWKSYGGWVYAPELVSLAIGHVLNAGITVAIAAAAASVAEHPSTAAILTLGVTVGTWIVNFFGAVRGGFWETVASYTPAAMVAQFQHGLIRLDTTLIAIELIAAGLIFAAIWTRIGIAISRRVYWSIAMCVVAALFLFATTFAWQSWDTSENRANSFSESEEQALRQIHGPLRVEVHLAPEDSRRVDLENRVVSKLRRVMRTLDVEYVAKTSIGIFEQSNAGYGEVWYSLGGRKLMNRGTTAEGVLETIFALANVAPPVETDEVFRGHPLAVAPRGAPIIFYVLWPSAIVGAAFLVRRSQRTPLRSRLN